MGSVPSSIPSFLPSASPTKTLSYVPTAAPSKSSQPTATCAATDIGAISGVSTKISTVAIHGNYMLVGNEAADKVELFMREDESSSWLTVKSYEPSEPLYYSSKFGDAITLDDQHIVVTSEGYYASDTGRLFIYDRATDTETIIENPGLGVGNDLFGGAVALFGNIIVVAAKYDDTLFSNSGIVYIFKKNAGVWENVQAITAPTGSSNDYFGISVATSGGVITVGAPYYDQDLSYRAGAVYFYLYNSNQGSVELLDSMKSPGYNTRKGYSVVMEGNRIAVSSPGYYIEVYMYSTTKTLTLIGTMTSSATDFGRVMAISGNTVVSVGGASYSGQTLYQQIICGGS